MPTLAAPLVRRAWPPYPEQGMPIRDRVPPGTTVDKPQPARRATPSVPALPGLLDLQRSVGNRAVVGMIARGQEPVAPPRREDPVPREPGGVTGTPIHGPN